MGGSPAVLRLNLLVWPHYRRNPIKSCGFFSRIFEAATVKMTQKPDRRPAFDPRRDFPMRRAAVPMSYVHERYLGRPSCPKCGQLLMAPESSKYHHSDDDIRHAWLCEGCEFPFETVVSLDAVAA
jgi:hypothetical protein